MINLIELRRLAYLGVLAYFPLMIVSNVAQIKFNHILGALLTLASIFVFSVSKKNFAIIVFISALILIKYALFGAFGIKALIVLVGGPLLFSCFKVFFDGLSDVKKEAGFLCIMMLCASLCLIIVFQYSGFLPLTIGAMEFLNTAGYTLSGDYSNRLRPSAYFYHPYDTAISILPLATYLIYSIFRCSKYTLPKLAILIGVIYALGLKVFYLYAAILVLMLFVFRRVRIKSYVLPLLFLVALGASVYVALHDFGAEVVGYTAGRVYIWNIMVEHFLQYGTLSDYLFGYSNDILSESLFWASDETFTTHNQYLYFFVHLGIIFGIAFWYLFSKTVLGKSRELDIMILALAGTFGLTGDLFIFFTFWICLCQLHVVAWKVRKDDKGSLSICRHFSERALTNSNC